MVGYVDVGGQTVLLYLLSWSEKTLFIDKHLKQEPRHLTARKSFGGRIVEQGDAAGPLQQAEEIVGIERHFLVESGHAVGFTQVVGYERGVLAGLGQHVFSGGDDDDVGEVEATGLEHTHHLYSFHGFAMERNGGGGEQLTDQAADGVDLDLQNACGMQSAQAVENGVGAEERFSVELLLAEVVLVLVVVGDGDGADYTYQVINKVADVVALRSEHQ